MTMVRFATACNLCGKRSEEYTAWPTCRDCDAHVCPDCAAPDSPVTGDGERQDAVTCVPCAQAVVL